MIYKAIIEDLCQNLIYEDVWEEATIIIMGRIAINDKPYLTHYVFVLSNSTLMAWWSSVKFPPVHLTFGKRIYLFHEQVRN